MTPEASYFNAPNISGEGTHRIAYYVWTCENEPQGTIFCVHGLTRNARDFDFIARELRKTHRVITVDMPGRGESEYLTDFNGYNYVAYMMDCISLLQNLQLPQVQWLGTSMGGIIGMMIAAMHPSVISKLVMNDIGYFIPKEALEHICSYAGKEQLFDTEEEIKAYMHEVMAPFGFEGEQQWTHVYANTIRKKDDKFTLNYDPNILEPVRAQTNNYTNIQDTDLSELWQGVTCPTLLIHGLESTLLPQDIAREMAIEEHVTLYKVPGVGHPPALMSDEQIKTVADWLRS